jgi:hypothetical protein
MSQNRKKSPPPYRTLRCPMVGHQATWCRFLCKPINGIGLCGRTAPHALRSRFQRAIQKYKECHEAG